MAHILFRGPVNPRCAEDRPVEALRRALVPARIPPLHACINKSRSVEDDVVKRDLASPTLGGDQE